MNNDPYVNYDKDFVHITDEKKIENLDSIPKTIQKDMPKKISVLKIIFLSIIVLLMAIGAAIFYVYHAFTRPGALDIVPTVIDIPKGASLQRVTMILGNAKIIRSPFLFRASMILGGLESSIKTGEYTFSKPIIMAEVVERLIKGKYEYIPVRLIIREGEDSHDIAHTIFSQFPKIATTTVLSELQKREGKLFPETYMFAPFATLDEILSAIDTEYQKRIALFRTDIASSTRTELEILTIASILEKEVPKKEDMKVVAGIIYNRLRKNMPLQMDSTVGYFTGKASLELTLDDLKIDSPYNTYVNKGIPPAPIGNPGEVSIDAALHPDTHQYIFFLSDETGLNHYAVTYAEHLNNRKKYLGK